jgi:hypothetical protein
MATSHNIDIQALLDSESEDDGADQGLDGGMDDYDDEDVEEFLRRHTNGNGSSASGSGGGGPMSSRGGSQTKVHVPLNGHSSVAAAAAAMAASSRSSTATNKSNSMGSTIGSGSASLRHKHNVNNISTLTGVNGSSNNNNVGGIGIEDILRETDECDNVEDVVNSLLHQAQTQNRNGMAATGMPHSDDDDNEDDDDDDDADYKQLLDDTNDSLSSTEEFLKQHRSYREKIEQSRSAAPSGNDGGKDTLLISDEEDSSDDDDSMPLSLNNDEEEGNDNDNDPDYISKSAMSTKYTNAPRQQQQRAGSASVSGVSYARSTMSMPRGASSGASVAGTMASSSSSTHNPQEWAVLQAILAENDEDDDGANQRPQQQSGSTSSVPKRNISKGSAQHPRSRTSGASTNLRDVDAILQSMEDEDDDDGVGVGGDVDYNMMHSYALDNDDDDEDDLLDYTTLPRAPAHLLEDDDDMDIEEDMMRMQAARGSADPSFSSSTNRPKPLSMRDSTISSVHAVAEGAYYDGGGPTSSLAIHTNHYGGNSSSIPSSVGAGGGGGMYFSPTSDTNGTISDSMTMAAMTQAQFYESRLLRGYHDNAKGEKGNSNQGDSSQSPGGGDHNHQFNLVSPLSVKRRMKPKLELWTKSRQKHQQQQDEHQGGGGSHNNKSKSRKEFGKKGGGGAEQNSNKGQQQPQPSRYNFAGILDVTPLEDVAKQMTRAAAAAPNNLPTALAVSEKFMCLGTQSGLVYVYDMFQQLRQTLASPVTASSTSGGGAVGAYHRSNKQGPGVSVTSMDVSANGETLLAGYTNGMLILWDTLTGKALKHCTDVHPQSPITSVRYVAAYTNAQGNGASPSKNASNAGALSSANEGTYACISVDASGLVNKLVFTKSIVSNLWGGGGYSLEVECLLDGTAGKILSLEILPPLSFLDKQWRHIYEVKKHFMRRVVLIGLSSAKSSFVVAVEPSIQVLHRWSRLPPPSSSLPSTATPSSNNNNNNHYDDDHDDDEKKVANSGAAEQQQKQLLQEQQQQPYLPCLAWGWSLVSGGGNVVHPILARAWGTTVQMLRANYIDPVGGIVDDSDTSSVVSGNNPYHAAAPHQQQQWPAFGVLSDDEFDTDHPVLSLEWINERSLAYLTETSEFTIIDTVCMTLMERVSFSSHKVVYAEMKLAGTSKGAMSTTFNNSIRGCVSDHRLYVTCQQSLLQINLQSTKNLILEKEANGEWLQALALALDYYENYVKVLEDRLRQRDQWDARGRDLRWHPEFGSGGDTAAAAADEWITNLLLRYLKLAVENAPIQKSASRRLLQQQRHHDPNVSGGRVVDLTLSHFTMLAGVCVEYCIGTRRLQVLFQQVYPIFRQIGYEAVFLNVLQPYILKDSLKYFSPEVMAAFVEHCKRRSDIEGVERCLLHLDGTYYDRVRRLHRFQSHFCSVAQYSRESVAASRHYISDHNGL